jgi:hypothetical protein
MAIFRVTTTGTDRNGKQSEITESFYAPTGQQEAGRVATRYARSKGHRDVTVAKTERTV